jgi:hypothetical protein
VNLRTFLPPLPIPTANAPRPGEPARELPPPGLEPGRAAIVAFLRHTGCPFAEATARALREAAAAEPEIAFVAVSHAPTAATARWRDAIGGLDDVRVLIDPERIHYATWGVGRTGLGHFMGRRSMTEVGRLARQGIRNRHPDGTRWQRSGTFALDANGVVRWRHLPAHAGDLPPLTHAIAALRGA